jgi:galactonate dehydratase
VTIWPSKSTISAEKPGIGVEINEEAMRRYAPEGVPLFA